MNENRVRPVTLVLLCLMEFAALGALTVPGIVGLQLRVLEFDADMSPESRLSWVTTSGAISAIVATPLFGWLSDSTFQRRGHRGAWMLWGSISGAVFVVLAYQAGSLPGLVLFWVAAQASYGAVFAALFGSLADFVPAADRPRVAGWFAAGGFAAVLVAGSIAYLLLGGHLKGFGTSEPAFMSLALFSVPVAAATSWHLVSLALERRGTAKVRAVPRPAMGLRAWLADLAGAGAPFWWLLGQRFLVQSAYTCMTAYGVLYLIRRTGEAPHDAGALVAGLTAIGATTGMVIAGGLARRAARLVGFRAAMAGGICFLLAADVILSVATTTTAYTVAHLCAGIGLGTYLALDLVVGLTSLPPAVAGRVMGYFNVTRKIPNALVPVVGPALLAIGTGDLVGLDRSQNYFALFVFGVCFAVVALAITPKLVVPGRDGVPVRHHG